MKLPIYFVNAFTNQAFSGNPAAVCLLPKWLDDNYLQKIATELNQPATAFVVKKKQSYEMRWFDNASEKKSCGHGTLAAAYVIFNYTNQLESSSHSEEKIHFITCAGDLYVKQKGQQISLTAPIIPMRFCAVPAEFNSALGAMPLETYEAAEQYIAILPDAELISRLTPQFDRLAKLKKRAILVTAKGQQTDFVLRYFTPRALQKEDAVTGTALCIVTSYWANQFSRTRVTAQQLSPRGSQVINCELHGEFITLTSNACLVMTGELFFKA